MRIIGCDLHARQQTVAMLDADSGELGVTSPSFCTRTSERVYITARACELEFGGVRGLQAAGAGGL
jgi:hypothetical protein